MAAAAIGRLVGGGGDGEGRRVAKASGLGEDRHGVLALSVQQGGVLRRCGGVFRGVHAAYGRGGSRGRGLVQRKP